MALMPLLSRYLINYSLYTILNWFIIIKEFKTYLNIYTKIINYYHLTLKVKMYSYYYIYMDIAHRFLFDSII